MILSDPIKNIFRRVERVALISPGQPIGLYGYIDMNQASLVLIRAHDWGQSLIGVTYSGTFQLFGRQNIYYYLDINSGGVITDTVSNTLYITQYC